MNFEDKVEKFRTELSYIRNEQIKFFASEAIKTLPDYFFEIPASSTGHYHPEYALGEGGLLRHTEVAVRVATDIFRTDMWKFTEDEKDLVIVGLILHDGWKMGEEKQKYTIATHPLSAVYEIVNNEYLRSLLSPEQLLFLTENMRTHMGKWVNHPKTGEKVLDPPETESQKFTHLMDYLASRKYFSFDFNQKIERE